VGELAGAVHGERSHGEIVLRFLLFSNSPSLFSNSPSASGRCVRGPDQFVVNDGQPAVRARLPVRPGSIAYLFPVPALPQVHAQPPTPSGYSPGGGAHLALALVCWWAGILLAHSDGLARRFDVVDAVGAAAIERSRPPGEASYQE